MNLKLSQVKLDYNSPLIDLNSNGRIRPWRDFKVSNILLSHAYRDFNYKKADRLVECAKFVKFEKVDSKIKLAEAWFCRVRLCPMCAWRRSLKTAANVHQIMQAISKDRLSENKSDYKYIFLTLTVKNCIGDNLKNILDEMGQAWDKFIKTREFKVSVKGFFKATEVTHNTETGEFHPHFHILALVDSSYFTGKKYMSQELITELWKRSGKLDYTPIVNVKKVKGNTAKAVAELAKYSVKSNDYIFPNDWDLTVDTVKILDKALEHRRFISFGGLMKVYHKKLNLENEETGDLIHISSKEKLTDNQKNEICYIFHSGYKQYYLVE